MRISDWSSTCALPIYPHSWRSKAKVIYRCTPQWFVPMDKVMTHISPKTPSDRRWENEGGALDPHKEDLCDAPTLRQAAMQAIDLKLGRASCRERVCQYVEISVVAV